MKKYFWLLIIIIAGVGLYMYGAHWYTYYRIGVAGLPSPDATRTYFMGENKQKNIIYAALGDSLTSGVGVDNYQASFPYLVAEKLMARDNAQVTLKNFSYPGYRTEDVINNLLPQLIAVQPDLVTLLIGVNDIHGRVDVEIFKKNYQNILQTLTTKTKAKIYIINIPYIGSNTLLLPPYNEYFKQKDVEFNQVINSLASDYKLKVIDLYSQTLELFEHDGSHYCADKFHPSAEGYKLWAQIIYDNLNH